ncbi:MAG: hypothetical protein VX768_20470 [Planctomycetota bacterium]|nr:hypothetical protein [Planctomycetota bacterium]
MTSRKDRIEQMLADSPGDQFLRYSLAMELRKEGENERCTELFSSLTRDAPPHVPAFLMFAQYFAENDRIDEARSVLREGIEVARAQNESHAAGEMGELLATLGAEGESA